MLAGQATPVRAAVRLKCGRLHSFTDYYLMLVVRVGLCNMKKPPANRRLSHCNN